MYNTRRGDIAKYFINYTNEYGRFANLRFVTRKSAEDFLKLNAHRLPGGFVESIEERAERLKYGIWARPNKTEVN